MRSKRISKPPKPVIRGDIPTVNIQTKHVRVELLSNSDEVPQRSAPQFAPKQPDSLEETSESQHVCRSCQCPSVQNLQHNRADHRVKGQGQTDGHHGLG